MPAGGNNPALDAATLLAAMLWRVVWHKEVDLDIVFLALVRGSPSNPKCRATISVARLQADQARP